MDKPVHREKISQLHKGALKRVLGVSDIFAVGYGDLGSSIYYALGITTLFSLGAAPISLLIAGLVFACTALTYAELSSMSHEAGGSAMFTRKAFNDLISFIAGWGLLLDFIVTIAISAYSIPPYLSYFFPLLRSISWKLGFSVVLIGLLFLGNIKSPKHSTRISWLLTILTLSTQLMIIIIGAIWLVDLPVFIEHLRVGIKNSSWSPSWPEFLKGTAMAMVAYTGIESMAQLGQEAKTPAKSVPKAMMYAMFTLIFMYLGISIVALSGLSPQELSTTYLEDPVAGIVSVLPFGGKFLAPWVGVLGAIILLVAANAGLIGASRLSFNMGQYYQIPRVFYKLHPKFRTPLVSLGTFGILAAIIILCSGGKLAFLADLYNFGAMLAFFSAHLSLLMMRVKQPDAKRPFKVPFNIRFKNGVSLPITSILGCLATAATWVLVVITKPDGRYLGFAWIAFGLAMYFYYRKKKRIAPMGQVKLEKVSIPEFKTFDIKKILVPTRGGMETETVQIACSLAKQHGATVKAVNIIEVPFSLPLTPLDELPPEAPLHRRIALAQAILRRAEAIGEEFGTHTDTEILTSRSITKTILDLLDEGDFDLIVLGSQVGPHNKGVGSIVEDILKQASCRVWICGNT